MRILFLLFIPFGQARGARGANKCARPTKRTRFRVLEQAQPAEMLHVLELLAQLFYFGVQHLHLRIVGRGRQRMQLKLQLFNAINKIFEIFAMFFFFLNVKNMFTICCKKVGSYFFCLLRKEEMKKTYCATQPNAFRLIIRM